MTLFDRLTSFIFSEPEMGKEEEMEEDDTQKITLQEPEEKNYMSILENINFDGKDYKSVYKKLSRYFELKPRPEAFSPYEKKLIKQLVDSVTEGGDAPVKLKTTSILKRRRLKPIPKIIPKVDSEKASEIEEMPPESRKVQMDKFNLYKGPKIISREDTISPLEASREYIIRNNGQRAKIFSARFDEDYEGIMEPKEPIQIVTSQPPHPIYPDRLIPKFKTEDNEIPRKYELLLKEESDLLLSQQSISQPKALLDASQDLSTQKSMAFSPQLVEPVKPVVSSKPQEPTIDKKEDLKAFKFELKTAPKPVESAPFTFSTKFATQPKRNDVEDQKNFQVREKPPLSYSHLQSEVKPQSETKPFSMFETKTESKEPQASIPKIPDEKPKPFILGVKSESQPLKAKPEEQSKPFTFNFSKDSAPLKDLATQTMSESMTSTQEKSKFVFGAPQPKAEPESKGEEEKIPKFSFGTGNTPSTNAPFVFGSQPSQSTSANSQTTPFQFNLGPSVPQQQAAQPPFSFGSPASTPSFTFGSTQSQSQQSPFSFSQSQQPPQQLQFAFGSQPGTSQPAAGQLDVGSQPSQFSFGSTQPFQSQSSQPILQPTSDNVPSSPFSTTSTTSNRKISQPILKRKR